MDDTRFRIKKEQQEKNDAAPKDKVVKQFNELKSIDFPQELNKIDFADNTTVSIGDKVKSLFWRSADNSLEFAQSTLDFSKAVIVERIEAVSKTCVLYYFQGDKLFYQARHFKKV